MHYNMLAHFGWFTILLKNKIETRNFLANAGITGKR